MGSFLEPGSNNEISIGRGSTLTLTLRMRDGAVSDLLEQGHNTAAMKNSGNPADRPDTISTATARDSITDWTDRLRDEKTAAALQRLFAIHHENLVRSSAAEATLAASALELPPPWPRRFAANPEKASWEDPRVLQDFRQHLGMIDCRRQDPSRIPCQVETPNNLEWESITSPPQPLPLDESRPRSSPEYVKRLMESVNQQKFMRSRWGETDGVDTGLTSAAEFDYQKQLKLLEEQNKARLIQARRYQSTMHPNVPACSTGR